MTRYRINYKEGYVFAVPLDGGGYALGVAARLSKKPGGVLGYFFGPRITKLPDPAETLQLRANDALWVKKFGDLGLVKNEWPIIGKMPHWDARDWPLPVFGGVDILRPTKGYIIEYDPNDIHSELSLCEVGVEALRGLPKQGLSGAGAVVETLSLALPEFDITPLGRIGVF
jgi:Immunity protein 26